MAKYDGNALAWIIEEQIDNEERMVCPDCGDHHTGHLPICGKCLRVEEVLSSQD